MKNARILFFFTHHLLLQLVIVLFCEVVALSRFNRLHILLFSLVTQSAGPSLPFFTLGFGLSMGGLVVSKIAERRGGKGIIYCLTRSVY
jgi:hypothetical protein